MESESLTSRERTFLALNFEEPDRVPLDFWMSEGFRHKLESALNTSSERFLDVHDIDLRYIQGPAYIGPPLREFPDGSLGDIWGVPRKAVAVKTREGMETYREVTEFPLASATTVNEVDEYPFWPSPDWFEYDGIEAQCDHLRSQDRVAVFMGDRLNRIAQLKPAMYLRGVEQILQDMCLNPDVAHAVFSNIRRFYLAYAERIFEAANGKLDIVLTGDDFGSQNGLLLSPGMWVEFLGPGFADYVGIAKNHDLRVMHHTCGSVRPLIPCLLERGLDILQSLQPEASNMNPREFKAEFRGRLAFHGGVSIQRTLPFCGPQEVRDDVRGLVEALGPGGGYILCTSHNIQADTPLENVQALLSAYREFGAYS